MLAATVPGVLLMVVVAIGLMTLIAWLLPMGVTPVSRDLRPERRSGAAIPGAASDPTSWRRSGDIGH